MITEVHGEPNLASVLDEWPIFDSNAQSIENLGVLSIHVRREGSRETLADATAVAFGTLRELVEPTTAIVDRRPLLLAAHSTWQPDSRLMRRRQLCGDLIGELQLPASSSQFEKVVSQASGQFRCACLIEVGWPGLASVGDYVRRVSSAAIVMPREGGVESEYLSALYRWGFVRPDDGGEEKEIQWGRFVTHCFSEDIYVIRVYGQFDDRDVFVDLFAGRPVVESLTSAGP